MRLVKWGSGADRFSVMATLRWGFGATSSPRQTHLPGRGQAHPRKVGRLGVKRVFEQLSREDVEKDVGPKSPLLELGQHRAAVTGEGDRRAERNKRPG